jgi:hypothetical protein
MIVLFSQMAGYTEIIDGEFQMKNLVSDDQLRQHADQIVAAVKELAPHTPHAALATATDYAVSGSFAWATAFVYSTLYTNPTLDYSTGQKFSYSGTAWGVGFGGGKLWTAGTMVIPPNALAGPADFSVAVLGGVTYISFTRNGSFIGSVAGAGLSIGVSAVTGDGEFKSA